MARSRTRWERRRVDRSVPTLVSVPGTEFCLRARAAALRSRHGYATCRAAAAGRSLGQRLSSLSPTNSCLRRFPEKRSSPTLPRYSPPPAPSTQPPLSRLAGGKVRVYDCWRPRTQTPSPYSRRPSPVPITRNIAAVFGWVPLRCRSFCRQTPP